MADNRRPKYLHKQSLVWSYEDECIYDRTEQGGIRRLSVKTGRITPVYGLRHVNIFAAAKNRIVCQDIIGDVFLFNTDDRTLKRIDLPLVSDINVVMAVETDEGFIVAAYADRRYRVLTVDLEASILSQFQVSHMVSSTRAEYISENIIYMCSDGLVPEGADCSTVLNMRSQMVRLPTKQEMTKAPSMYPVFYGRLYTSLVDWKEVSPPREIYSFVAHPFFGPATRERAKTILLLSKRQSFPVEDPYLLEKIISYAIKTTLVGAATAIPAAPL